MQEDLEKKKAYQFAIHMEEYKSLKAEQLKRIAVRDHVIYLTIASVGLLLTAMDKLPNGLLLLAIPWIGVLLGWKYLVNDQKVSAIGRYIRHNLDGRLKNLVLTSEDVFKWETEHRSDEQRCLRKYIQLTLDMLTFVVPGVFASCVFLIFYGKNIALNIIAGTELLLLFVLAWQIIVYTDFVRGK